jgi:hypothetical protein
MALEQFMQAVHCNDPSARVTVHDLREEPYRGLSCFEEVLAFEISLAPDAR